jgi:hypothetical protein
VRASCLVNCFATGQMLRVVVSLLLSPSKCKSFTSLTGGHLLCGPYLSVAVGFRTASTFLFLIWAVEVSSSGLLRPEACSEIGSEDLFWPSRSPFLFFWEARGAAYLPALYSVRGCRRLGGRSNLSPFAPAMEDAKPAPFGHAPSFLMHHPQPHAAFFGAHPSYVSAPSPSKRHHPMAGAPAPKLPSFPGPLAPAGGFPPTLKPRAGAANDEVAAVVCWIFGLFGPAYKC